MWLTAEGRLLVSTAGTGMRRESATARPYGIALSHQTRNGLVKGRLCSWGNKHKSLAQTAWYLVPRNHKGDRTPIESSLRPSPRLLVRCGGHEYGCSERTPHNALAVPLWLC